MPAQYDPNKEASSLKAHGVSFADAEGVLWDPLALTVEDPDAAGERRFVSVGHGRTGEFERNADPMRAEYDFSKGKRGAVISEKGKTRITIFIDNAILAEFRARAVKAGTGYQTMMNEALRTYLAQAGQPVTEQVLRNVLRQEMPEYLAVLGVRPGGRSTAKASRAGRGSAKQSALKK